MYENYVTGEKIPKNFSQMLTTTWRRANMLGRRVINDTHFLVLKKKM